jgi:hypothetical protein
MTMGGLAQNRSVRWQYPPDARNDQGRRVEEVPFRERRTTASVSTMCVGNRPRLRVGPFIIARRYIYLLSQAHCCPDFRTVWRASASPGGRVRAEEWGADQQERGVIDDNRGIC